MFEIDHLFPGATWHPVYGHSNPGTLAARKTIVLHITVGPTASSAINTFVASKEPNRVSSQFVIDRDSKGTVYQLMPLSETAWHASQCNEHSIGIEHAAIPVTMMATEAQYEQSAQLCAWLAKLMGIPVDRAHIRTHYEASPRDGHVKCCTGALDPDRVVKRAAEIAATAGHPPPTPAVAMPCSCPAPVVPIRPPVLVPKAA
jgi:N-acetyl-anhydromuramyl-L-alanine amidase AmpD